MVCWQLGLQHHLNGGMSVHGAIEVIDLRFILGSKRDGHREVFAAAARFRFHGSLTEIGNVLVCNHHDLIFKLITIFAHHLDRELAGEFKQGIFTHRGEVYRSFVDCVAAWRTAFDAVK